MSLLDVIIKLMEQLCEYCEKGDLDNVKKVISEHNLNIHYGENRAFRIACFYGHLDVAKYLHSIGADPHDSDDFAFAMACRDGNIIMAKWLYSLGNTDIHTHDDYAFKYAWVNKHFVIAKWLYDMSIFTDKQFDIGYDL